VIDTIVLKIPFSCVHSDDNDYLFSVRIRYLSYGVASRVDTSQHQDIYVPAMVVKKYQYTDFKTKETYDVMFFYITFSIAKLFYNQNLYEVDDRHFSQIVTKLKSVMEKCGIYIKEEDIIKSEVREIHYSKNILLQTATTAKTLQLLNTGHLTKLSSKYKEYAEGEQLSFNCGTHCVTFYDKVKEIRHQCRQLRNDGELRDAQAEAYAKAKNKNILRMEVKLKNIKKIKNVCEKLEIFHKDVIDHKMTFKNLFKCDIARKVCLHFYEKIQNNISLPKVEDLKSIAEAILDDDTFLTGRCFSSIGVAFCLFHFGRKRTSQKSPKRVREVEQLINAIKTKKSEDKMQYNPLDEVWERLHDFELIDDMEDGILDRYDNEEIIGYRKRAFTAEEKEAICGQALNKCLPQSQEGYRRVLREMLEVNGGKSLPETNEEALILYHEYKGVQREKELQRIRGESGEVSGVIDNPNFKEKKKKSSEDKEESLDETRKWIEEKFQNNLSDSQKELKNAEPKKKKEPKKRTVQKPKKENISKNEVKDKITLLTPEEMFPDDPYRIEMYYHEQKIAKETPEQRKAREDVIAEQERKIREIERTARNIRIYDGPREELKIQQAGSKEILNPNYKESKKPEEPQAEAVVPKKLTRLERQVQWQREADEYNKRIEKLVADVKQEEAEAQAKEEALNNKSQYNDSS